MKFICFLLILIAFATLQITSQQDVNTNGCNTNCDLSLLPICGTDDSGKTRTFPNECIMKSENCIHKYNFQRTANGTCP